MSGDPALPERTKQQVQDRSNEIYLSVVSLWEVIVKHALGKITLPQPPERYVPSQRHAHGILSLSLEESSVSKLASLPSIHRDPFDRMLVCQALDYGLHVASSDVVIRSYPVILL